MIRSRFRLRTRFIAALLLVAGILSAGFYVAMYQFIEVLESELQDRLLAHELTEFAEVYARDPDMPPLQAAGMTGYVVRPGEAASPPPQIERIAAGQLAAVTVDGVDFYVGRQDVGDTRLYLALDVSGVESLESRLVRLAWIVIVGGLIVSAAVGLLLSQVVIGPVVRLANFLGSLTPSMRGVRLQAQSSDRDVGIIAAAFDRYLEQLDEFVIREQAFTEEVSHELRTPLATVLSAVQLLREGHDLSEQERERVERIHRAATKMNALIEALLFLARADGGLRVERCALDDIVRDAVDAHRDAAVARGLELSCEIATPETVVLPAGMAYCVISNLIDNAVQHTDRGRINVRLEHGKLTVQDTGKGIAESEQRRIFERGYRGSGSRGLGLGLHLVQRICHRLGWEIRVGNEPGAGARFELTLVPAS